MGSKCSPAVASTFMDYFEKKHIYTYHTHPLLWKRYIDNVICIWTEGLDALLEFEQFINSIHPCIKFTMHYFDTHTHTSFLDTTLISDAEGQLSTTLIAKIMAHTIT